MDEFVERWSGDFEDFLSCGKVVASPPGDVVPPNPSGAHADSDTDASLSPVSSPEAPRLAEASTGSMRPKSPELPPWKKRQTYVPGPKVLPKARPDTRPPSLAAHQQQSPSGPAPGQGSSSSSTSPMAKAIDQALADYRAAEKAINACAKESLYGPYNECYYTVEKKNGHRQRYWMA